MQKIEKLMYLAIPSRMAYAAKKFKDYAFKQGYAPLCPFRTFPFQEFEGNPKIGREKSLEWCLRLVEIGDVFGMFGISEGTLNEFEHAYNLKKPIFLYFKEFDNQWRLFYNRIASEKRRKIDEIMKKR